jgi:hypothetical protein
VQGRYMLAGSVAMSCWPIDVAVHVAVAQVASEASCSVPLHILLPSSMLQHVMHTSMFQHSIECA